MSSRAPKGGHGGFDLTKRQMRYHKDRDKAKSVQEEVEKLGAELQEKREVREYDITASLFLSPVSPPGALSHPPYPGPIVGQKHRERECRSGAGRRPLWRTLRSAL